jgi:hypothetical protein
MSQLWIGPLLLALLSLGWWAVQRAWLACMGRPPGSDALVRPGHCGAACACSGDCPRRRDAALVASSNEETAS